MLKKMDRREDAYVFQEKKRPVFCLRAKNICSSAEQDVCISILLGQFCGKESREKKGVKF